MDDIIGQIIGRKYEIIQKIGAGGMGLVYKARDIKTHQFVALKMLNPGTQINTEFVTLLLNEVMVHARVVNHQNIVKLHNISFHRPYYFLVMDCINGGSLDDLLDKQLQLSINYTIEIGIQIIDAIAMVHSLGFVHGDIKPKNVLLNEYGVPLLTDFGLAQAIHINDENSEARGTIHYMTPEAITFGKVDEQLDIWSFGVMLYEMIAGCLPFESLNSILDPNEQAADLTILRPDIPDTLASLISWILQKNPDDRNLSASDVYVVLNAIAQQNTQSPESEDFQLPKVDARKTIPNDLPLIAEEQGIILEFSEETTSPETQHSLLDNLRTQFYLVLSRRNMLVGSLAALSLLAIILALLIFNPSQTPVTTPTMTPKPTESAGVSTDTPKIIPPTATFTPSLTPTVTPSFTPSATFTPTPTPTNTPTATPTITFTPSSSFTPEITAKPIIINNCPGQDDFTYVPGHPYYVDSRAGQSDAPSLFRYDGSGLYTKLEVYNTVNHINVTIEGTTGCVMWQDTTVSPTRTGHSRLVKVKISDVYYWLLCINIYEVSTSEKSICQ